MQVFLLHIYTYTNTHSTQSYNLTHTHTHNLRGRIFPKATRRTSGCVFSGRKPPTSLSHTARRQTSLQTRARTHRHTCSVLRHVDKAEVPHSNAPCARVINANKRNGVWKTHQGAVSWADLVQKAFADNNGHVLFRFEYLTGRSRRRRGGGCLLDRKKEFWRNAAASCLKKQKQKKDSKSFKLSFCLLTYVTFKCLPKKLRLHCSGLRDFWSRFLHY